MRHPSYCCTLCVPLYIEIAKSSFHIILQLICITPLHNIFEKGQINLITFMHFRILMLLARLMNTFAKRLSWLRSKSYRREQVLFPGETWHCLSGNYTRILWWSEIVTKLRSWRKPQRWNICVGTMNAGRMSEKICMNVYLRKGNITEMCERSRLILDGWLIWQQHRLKSDKVQIPSWWFCLCFGFDGSCIESAFTRKHTSSVKCFCYCWIAASFIVAMFKREVHHADNR